LIKQQKYMVESSVFSLS